MCGECCCHLLTNCFSDVGIGGNNGFLWTASSDWSHLLFTEKRHSSVLVSCLKPVVWKNVEADALIADKYWSIDLPIQCSCFQEPRQ